MLLRVQLKEMHVLDVWCGDEVAWFVGCVLEDIPFDVSEEVGYEKVGVGT